MIDAAAAEARHDGRIDDIEYGGTGDFGNKGRLTDLLKTAISEAPH